MVCPVVAATLMMGPAWSVLPASGEETMGLPVIKKGVATGFSNGGWVDYATVFYWCQDNPAGFEAAIDRRGIVDPGDHRTLDFPFNPAPHNERQIATARRLCRCRRCRRKDRRFLGSPCPAPPLGVPRFVPTDSEGAQLCGRVYHTA
jgi:hypothetical protein